MVAERGRGWWGRGATCAGAAIGLDRAGGIVGIVLVVTALAWLAVRLWRAVRAPKSSEYVGDEFFGVTWCWGWGLREDLTQGLIDLGCYCPTCGARAPLSWIIPRDDEGGPVSGFDCPFCRSAVRIAIDARELEAKIVDAIDRKLRGDAWTEAVLRLRHRDHSTSHPKPGRRGEPLR